jgi:hypothetical protein
MTPGEQLLASAIATNPKIEHLHTSSMSATQGALGGLDKTSLQLLDKAGLLVHLQRLGERITQNSNAQYTSRRLHAHIITAETSGIDPNQAPAFSAPDPLRPRPQPIPTLSVNGVEGRIVHAGHAQQHLCSS